MTNSPDWILIKAPEGGIIGVASASKEKPIKIAGFSEVDAGFAQGGMLLRLEVRLLAALPPASTRGPPAAQP